MHSVRIVESFLVVDTLYVCDSVAMFSGVMSALNSVPSESEDSSMSSSDMSSSYSWISWFVAQKDFLVEVDEEYARDSFNLYGLRKLFPYYDSAIEMILDPDCPDEEELEDPEYADVFKEAADLYGLIHARFLLSQKGLSMVKEKYLAGEFSTCPRTLCESQKCLPIGMYDQIGKGPVKQYCPKCEQVYSLPRHKSKPPLDGAWFGKSLPHMFLQTYPQLVPTHILEPFVPKIFGLRVHKHKSVIDQKIENDTQGIRVPQVFDPNVTINNLDSEDSS